MDEVPEGHFGVGFSSFFTWGKKLITVSFRMSVMLGVCHMADQVIFKFQSPVMTDRASVLMFWGFERYTLGLTSGLVHLAEAFVGTVLTPRGT